MKAGKIHKLAESLYKPRGSKPGNKVAAYSPEITVNTFAKMFKNLFSLRHFGVLFVDC